MNLTKNADVLRGELLNAYLSKEFLEYEQPVSEPII